MAEINSEIDIETRRAIHALALCGCGTNAHWEIIHFVLNRSAALYESSGTGQLSDKPGFYSAADDASGRWVEFAAKVLDKHDLLDHGTSIGGAWLTRKGEMLKAFLDRYGTDDKRWPESWGEQTGL